MEAICAEFKNITGKIRFTLNTGTSAQINGNTALSANIWYHITCVWDGANLYVYLNGVSNATPVAKKTGTMGR